MLHSFMRLSQVQLGFQPEGILTARVDLPQTQSETSSIQFFDQLLVHLKSLPGVEAASVSSATPLSSSFDRTTFKLGRGVAEAQSSPMEIGVHQVSLDFLQTLQIPLLKGRWLSSQDQPGQEDAIVINEAAARLFWPNQDPIGHTVKLGLDLKGPVARIVGVVGNVKYDSMETQFQPQAYISFNQMCYPGCYILIRGKGDPHSYALGLHEIAASLNREVPLHDIKTMQERISTSLSGSQFNTFLLISYASLALILAAIGVYGIISYTVAWRTREIGIRMALGARYADVIRMVLKQGISLVICGLVIGLAGALVLTRFMSSMLYEVRPTDPAAFLAVAALISATAMIACYFPARRAARVDPVISLRWE